jgi:hypothetical protein
LIPSSEQKRKPKNKLAKVGASFSELCDVILVELHGVSGQKTRFFTYNNLHVRCPESF